MKNVYPPLGTLKPIAEDVWIVDGPVVRFGMPWPKMPFPTRMTVIRIGGDLFIHSPTPLVPELRAEMARIAPGGTAAAILGLAGRAFTIRSIAPIGSEGQVRHEPAPGLVCRNPAG